MALADETDPIAVVVAVLEAAANSDWRLDTPTRIARWNNYSYTDKTRYQRGHALYVRTLGEAELTPMGASGDSQEERVSVLVECWANDAEGGNARTIAEDVRSIVGDYWTDNKDGTEWVTVRVTTETDYSHETWNERAAGGHDRYTSTVTLMRDDSV